MIRRPPRPPLFPYTPLSRSIRQLAAPPPPASPLSGRDCLTLAEFSPKEAGLILDEAAKMKALQKSRIPYRPLRGRTLAMVFQKPSNRPRVSFEVGMYQLGGHALHLLPQEIQMGRRETPSDTGDVLARYIDAIMVRPFDHEEAEQLADAAEVPVINGLTDQHHPCQALADLLTIREEFGGLEGVEISYIGDGNNVAHSLAIACAQTTSGTPRGRGRPRRTGRRQLPAWGDGDLGRRAGIRWDRRTRSPSLLRRSCKERRSRRRARRARWQWFRAWGDEE